MINLDKGIINKGDITRIVKTMKRAMAGEEITVAFLGGSITQGSLATTPDNCYAHLVYEWWSEKFPKAKVNYLNAGIGGTPSDFGVARVDSDVFKYNPDFLIVEFSVNDSATDYYMESYEGLVRHILLASEKVGLMLVHNVRYDNMESAEDKHVIVGKYYDIPEVSMKYSIYPAVANGSIKNRDITPDDLHPNDAGHLLLSKVIINALEKIYEIAWDGSLSCVSEAPLPGPLTKNSLENAVRLQNYNYNAVLKGFEPDTAIQNHITEMFRNGYTARKKGDSISFSTTCKTMLVQYRKSVNKPAPVAMAIVDGREEDGVVLDGNFDEDWGDCLYTQPVLLHGDDSLHEVEIRIIKDHSQEKEKDVVPFYLVSVIAGK